MAAISKLQALLDCSCIAGSSTQAILKEADVTATLKRVTLIDLKGGDLVIPIDDARRKKCSRCNNPGVRVLTILKEEDSTLAHKLIDYIVFRLRDDEEYDCILVDLKSGTTQGVSTQFQSTDCLVDYLLKILSVLHAEELKVKRRVYAVIQGNQKGSQLAKLPVGKNHNKRSLPTDPIRLYRKTGGTVRIVELLGKLI